MLCSLLNFVSEFLFVYSIYLLSGCVYSVLSFSLYLMNNKISESTLRIFKITLVWWSFQIDCLSGISLLSFPLEPQSINGLQAGILKPFLFIDRQERNQRSICAYATAVCVRLHSAWWESCVFSFSKMAYQKHRKLMGNKRGLADSLNVNRLLCLISHRWIIQEIIFLQGGKHIMGDIR